MKIREYQDRVDQWIQQYGVRYFDVKTNTILLMEEMGEFSRLIARRYGEQSFKNPEMESKVEDNIKEEMADMIFVISCLANQMEIDITEVLEKNLVKKTKRDAQRHIHNKKIVD